MLNTDIDVLVVEDDAVTRRMVCGQLQRLGVKKVREAKDGTEALEELKRQRPCLMITDWGLPQVDGLTLLRAARLHEGLKELPVLMITCRSEKEYILQAVQEGVNAYIVKPFDTKTLESKLIKILETSAAP